MQQSSLIYLHTQLKLNIMELQDILRIQQLVNTVNKVHYTANGDSLITEIGTDYIEISPKDDDTLHQGCISNIIRYTEAIGRHWFITSDQFGLRLHCF